MTRALARKPAPARSSRNLDREIARPFNKARAERLGQWFTDPELAAIAADELARILVAGGRLLVAPRVLEPCAGDGALVHATLEHVPGARVTAVDVDAGLVAELRRRFPRGVRFDLFDFLERELEHFDASILNPPQHKSRPGWDGEFLERAMQQAPRVVAILRLQALTGRDRFDRVWSRIGNGWTLTCLRPCALRPKFRLRGRKSGSPRHDFVLVSMMRNDVAGDVAPRVEWIWTGGADGL